MKLFIIFSLLLSFLYVEAQNYETLTTEKGKNPDADNSIFTSGKTFCYHLEVSKDTTQLFINCVKSVLTVSPDQSKNSIDEVQYTVVTVKNSKRLNKGQTEVAISYEPFKGIIDETGIVENQFNLWWHPPRSDFFRILELCPFPYIQLPAQTGKTWSDQQKIGDVWGDEQWGEWQGKLHQLITYKITGTETLNTSLGEFECFIIEGISTNKLGTSTLTSYYHPQVGFIKLEYKTINQLNITFSLVSIKDESPIHGMEEYYQRKLNNKDIEPSTESQV
ncbi:MAG: hypothetical protein JEZ14_16530 [Marinilabiliaceae bacterium]|nr:hypothetical protein [Marinilabiliaceae bacterium]